MEAKDTQLQQKDSELQQKDSELQQKDDEIQQQGMKLEEKTLQFRMQQGELQALRVRKLMFYCMSEKMMTSSLLWMLGGQRKATDRG